MGNIRPCDFFRPIARERNYLIDYNESNITGEYQALPKEMLNEKQQQMKKKQKHKYYLFRIFSSRCGGSQNDRFLYPFINTSTCEITLIYT